MNSSPAQLANLSRRWTATPDERFDQKVNRTDRCWLWTGATNPDGYGRFHHRGRLVSATHYYAYQRWVGPVLEEHHVLHECDTPGCVRPSHLYLGDRLTNMADMRRKGRDRRCPGEANGRARLTAAQVVAIRASTESHVALARRYGVGTSQIGRILRRESWRTV